MNLPRNPYVGLFENMPLLPGRLVINCANHMLTDGSGQAFAFNQRFPGYKVGIPLPLKTDVTFQVYNGQHMALVVANNQATNKLNHKGVHKMFSSIFHKIDKYALANNLIVALPLIDCHLFGNDPRCFKTTCRLSCAHYLCFPDYAAQANYDALKPCADDDKSIVSIISSFFKSESVKTIDPAPAAETPAPKATAGVLITQPGDANIAADVQAEDPQPPTPSDVNATAEAPSKAPASAVDPAPAQVNASPDQPTTSGLRDEVRRNKKKRKSPPLSASPIPPYKSPYDDNLSIDRKSITPPPKQPAKDVDVISNPFERDIAPRKVVKKNWRGSYLVNTLIDDLAGSINNSDDIPKEIPFKTPKSPIAGHCAIVSFLKSTKVTADFQKVLYHLYCCGVSLIKGGTADFTYNDMRDYITRGEYDSPFTEYVMQFLCEYCDACVVIDDRHRGRS